MGRVVKGLKHAWNAFNYSETSRGNRYTSAGGGGLYSGRDPSRARFHNDRNLLNSIFTKLTVDISSVEIKHVMADGEGKYVSDVKSGLNECLTVRPNLDQGPRRFLQDYAETLFKEGVAAIAPIEFDEDPDSPGGINIRQLRVGRVVEFRPREVVLSIYDDRPEYGCRRDLVVPKNRVAIVQNPFYDVMNEPNSVLQRLLRKMALLDSMDETAASNKLNLIIQMPFQVKHETQRQQANQRLTEIERQLEGSRHGIAYTDGTEKITQLNRAIENDILAQIPGLWEQLYTQLGITPEVLNGTADRATMANYQSRFVEPILDALAEEFRSKFLTKNARSRGQDITYYRNPFRLIPISDLADVADVFSRNEIVSPNEIRMYMGMKPSADKAADELRNSNMPDRGDNANVGEGNASPPTDGTDDLTGPLDELEGEIDSMLKEFGVDSEDEDEA